VYETWFVHNSIEFEPRSYAQWKKENNLWFFRQYKDLRN
jgi:hypothetical protein